MGCQGCQYGYQFSTIWGLTTMAHPLKNHSKIEETGLWAQICPRLRRAKRGFALRSVPHSPESATLAVTIIPVTPAVGVKTRGKRHYHKPPLRGGQMR